MVQIMKHHDLQNFWDHTAQAERRLWASVMYSMVHDLCSPHKNYRARQDAEGWVGPYPSADFREVASLAGLDPQATWDRMSAMAELPFEERSWVRDSAAQVKSERRKGNIDVDVRGMSSLGDNITSVDQPVKHAKLVGFTEQFGEQTSCSLVFHLDSNSGERYHLSLGKVLATLKFAEKEGAIAPMPIEWWAKIGRRDGCCIQDEAGETNDLPD
jgi:hypothetical protein